MKRRYTIIILALVLSLPLSGCGGSVFRNYREISQLLVVSCVGFDRTDGGVTVSVCAERDAEGGSAKKLSASGPSLTDAMERLQDWSDAQQVFYPHADYVLLGSGAAERAYVFMDYIERSVPLRLDAKLFVIKDGEAGPQVTGCGGEESDATKILDSMERGLLKTGAYKIYTCGEAAAALARDGSALLLLLLPCDNLGGGGDPTLLPGGYAVLKDGKLAGYLTGAGARGVTLLTGYSGSQAVYLPSGVTVELIAAETTMRPQQENGAPSGLQITLKAQANLAELPDALNAADPELIASLEGELARELQSWCRYVISSSKAMEADILGLGHMFGVSSPEERTALLKALPITADVSCKILHTYYLGAPAHREGGAG